MGRIKFSGAEYAREFVLFGRRANFWLVGGLLILADTGGLSTLSSSSKNPDL